MWMWVALAEAFVIVAIGGFIAGMIYKEKALRKTQPKAA